MISNKMSLEKPALAFSGEERYLTPLWVSRKGYELYESDPSQDGFELSKQTIHDKMEAVLKKLTFREQKVIVQFLVTSRDSERKFYDVDKDHDAEYLCPPARVFRLGLPEWTSNVTNYLPKDFPQQEWSRVGVIELLTSSKHPSFAYEVQRFQRALKTQNLTMADEVSGRTPVSDALLLLHETSSKKRAVKVFDSRMLGKVCMSTYGLPYYVKDLGLWPFREACMGRHLDKFCGFVGRAFLSSSSCFCEDVTKLNEDEYPLVHFARMHGLTSSFAIHLHSVKSNDDYVLEFFLPSHMKNIKHVLNLVQVLKQYFDQVTSRFELGDKSFIEAVGPPMDLCVNIEPDIMDTFIDVPDEWSSTSVSTTFTEGGETNSLLKLGKKCKRGSKKMVYVKATYGEDSKGFWFRNSWGLAKLKNKVAKRFKLKSQMIRLKYLDEDNDLILFSSNDDMEFAKIASGDNNRINLICESVCHRVD
ncbi:NIN-like protein [Tanacetum coccineum]